VPVWTEIGGSRTIVRQTIGWQRWDRYLPRAAVCMELRITLLFTFVEG